MSVTGAISATSLYVNGVAVTGGAQTDRITSGTSAVTVNATHYISVTNNGTVTGYFDSAGRLITPGISVTTNQLSATTAYFSGKVGIGTSTPSAKLDVVGSVSVTGNVSITDAIQATAYLHNSEERLKKDITVITSATDMLAKLRGVHFIWKNNNKPAYGVIAQDVLKVMPEAVYGAPGTMSVEYNQLLGPHD